MATICSSDDIDRWLGQAGDPTVMAWVVTVGYALAAWTSHIAMRRTAQQKHFRMSRWFWMTLMIAMIALGFNKQFDLQSLLIDCGRTMSREGGWFAHRRMVERGFAAMIAISLSLVLALGLRRLQRPRPAMLTAGTGIAILAGFILIRTGSILHVPGLDRATTGPLHNIMELCGVAAVALGGYLATARPSAG